MRVVMLRTNKVNPDPRVEKEISSLMKKKGFSVKVIAWDRTAKYQKREEILYLNTAEVPIVRFGIPATWGGGMKTNLLPMLRFELKLFHWLISHRQEYDVIHACDLLMGLPALVIARLFRKKLVYDVFDFYADTKIGPALLLRIFAGIERYIINKADATIICSEQRIEQIGKCHPRRLTVIHNSPSSEQLSESKTADKVCMSSSGRPKVVYVGNLVEDRYILQILNVAAGDASFELHIGGMGVLSETVQTYAQNHDNIFFYGRLAYRDTLKLESECDIMLALYDPAVNNHKYAAPNKFYEAMVLGKPIIMFRNTGMYDVIDKTGFGETIEPSEKELHTAIHKLIVKRETRLLDPDMMRKLFDEQYAWEIMEERLIALYRSLEE